MKLRHVLLVALGMLLLAAGSAIARGDAARSEGIEPCGYFVSVTGSDRADGASPAAPFATLERAQSAVRRDRSKVVCLRAGTYLRTAPLKLTAADDDETWQYYGPDGVNSAVLDGAGKLAGGIISIDGASRVTVNGLKLQRFADYGIVAAGGGRNPVGFGNTVENCDIGFNTTTTWNSGGIYFWGSLPSSTIRNNYVHDLGSMGIGLNSYDPGQSHNGSVISGNVVLRAVQRMNDGGAIYVSHHGGDQTSHVSVTNNFIRDYGAAGVQQVHGIYLDDNANDVSVIGNVLGPPTAGGVVAGHNRATSAFFVHNGHDNRIAGNIVDLGDSGQVSIVIWGHDKASIAGMAGNSFIGNIVLSHFSGRLKTVPGGGNEGYAYYQNDVPASAFTIRNNLYFNYASGGKVFSHGLIVGDGNPVDKDPQISGWAYAIASGSPVFRSPVDFRPIVGGWGPPGFTIPPTGAPPSSPH